jgi:hypothetical protein
VVPDDQVVRVDEPDVGAAGAVFGADADADAEEVGVAVGESLGTAEESGVADGSDESSPEETAAEPTACPTELSGRPDAPSGEHPHNSNATAAASPAEVATRRPKEFPTVTD